MPEQIPPWVPGEQKHLIGSDIERFRDHVTARYLGGLSIRQVAAEVGASYGRVHAHLKARGVAMRPRGGVRVVNGS